MEGKRNSSNTDNKKLRTSKTDDKLGALQLFFEGAQSVGELSTIPFVGEVAGLALMLLGSVQATRDNKSAFRQLVFDACTFSATVMKVVESFHRDQKKLPPRFHDAIKQLLDALGQIQRYAEKHSKRGLTKRYIFNIADKARVADCERSYQTALNTFKTLSAISTWANTEVLRTEEKEPAPTRASTVPMTSRQNFTVTDRSQGHTFITGKGGVIRQSTGLRVIMSGHPDTVGDKKLTDAPECSSPIPESPLLSFDRMDVFDYSKGHTYDTSLGGEIFLQQGATVAYS